MNWYENTVYLQIEPTTYCNAMCPGCMRVNSLKNDINNTFLEHLDLKVLRRVILEDCSDKIIEGVHFNGNLGDCGMYPHMIEIVDVLLESNPNMTISISTNAGMRSPEWWKSLAEKLEKFANNRIQVALDGLADTNHIYRKGVVFERVIANISAMTQTNANIEVITTAFEHNKHQFSEISALVESLGCQRHVIRKSYKPVMKDNDFGKILAAENIDLPITHTFKPFHKRLKKNMALPEDTSTMCKWYKWKRIQIDAYGTVWPCCHMPNNRTISEEDVPEGKVPADYAFAFDQSEYNINNRSLKEILSSEWFSKTLPKKMHSGEYFACNKNCSK